jgi:hypothetical protein
MNSCIVPNEFDRISIFDEKYFLEERELSTGQQRIILFYTVSSSLLSPIKEINQDFVIGDINEFKKLKEPES